MIEYGRKSYATISLRLWHGEQGKGKNIDLKKIKISKQFKHTQVKNIYKNKKLKMVSPPGS